MTANELIDAFGGNREMAKIAGVLTSAVSNWRKIGRLPPRLYLRVAAAGREREIAVPGELFQATTDEERRAPSSEAA